MEWVMEIREKMWAGVREILRFLVLGIASVFTAFPFVWMLLSALKTKAEVMDTSVFFPAEPQWQNIASVILDSPLIQYIGNSLFVSIITLAIQQEELSRNTAGRNW